MLNPRAIVQDADRKIYVSSDRVLIGYLRSVLEDQGIPCVVRNELLGGAVGELPAVDCWPELWVCHAEDAPLARRLVMGLVRPDLSRRRAWTCRRCREWIEPQFTACWRCGAGEDEQRLI